LNEPLLGNTPRGGSGSLTKPKYMILATSTSKLAVALLSIDFVATILLYLSGGHWKVGTLWSNDVRNYHFSTSLADVVFVMLMRLWLASIAISNRWIPLSIASAMCSGGFLVAKAAMWKDWADGMAIDDAVILLGMFNSVACTGVIVPFAIFSLTAFQYQLAEEEAEQNNTTVKKDLGALGFLRVLKPYFWPRGTVNRIRATSTLGILGVSKVTNILAPLYIRHATNDLASGTHEGLHKACVAASIYCVLRFCSTTFKEFQSMAYLSVKQAAYIEIAEYTFVHLHNLNLDWHLRKKMGNVLRSMDRGVESANNVVNYLFLFLVPTIVETLVVIGVFLLYFKDSSLALLVFISLVLYAHVTIKLTLWRKKFRENTNKHDNEYHDRATDSLVNYETVKYFCNEKYETARYSEAIGKYQKYSISTQYSLSLLNISQGFLQQGTMAGALCIMVLYGKDVGAFVAVQVYLVQLFTPLNFLGTIYGAIVTGLVDVQNLSELLAEEPELTDAKGALPLVPSRDKPPSVEYREVSFHYPTQDDTMGLHKVSFTAASGETSAIVGSTGSGKTTLGRLLFRFYDPLSGGVYIGGQNIRSVTQHSVRALIGVVPQDAVMFNDSILHNLKYGRMNATMEQIEKACAQAQILDFILGLPEQWETKVGERGLKLSGGEKQRVAIARCLLKDPPIVLLDEATSALDSRTERSVQRALGDLGTGRTTLVIAHRLSTIRNSERIIVMDKGQVVENGPHDELLACEGAYYQLWNAQLEDAELAPSSSSSSLPRVGSQLSIE